MGQENSDKIIVGDFNLDLLKINTRQKHAEYLDMMMCIGLYPKITLPTRFTDRSATLIDQIFCKLSHTRNYCKSGIIMSNLSDHLPAFTSIKMQLKQHTPLKYIQVATRDSNSLHQFYNEMNKINILNYLNPDLQCDPNANYNILEETIQSTMNKHLPTKTVKFNKYKHKFSPWITFGVLKSIQYRDSLYKQLKCTDQENSQFATLKQNLKVYNKILNKSILDLQQR